MTSTITRLPSSTYCGAPCYALFLKPKVNFNFYKFHITALLLVCDLDNHKIAIVYLLWCALLCIVSKAESKHKFHITALLLVCDLDNHKIAIVHLLWCYLQFTNQSKQSINKKIPTRTLGFFNYFLSMKISMHFKAPKIPVPA